MTDWIHSPDDLDLGSQHVDVWRVFLDPQPALIRSARSTLPAGEAERAAKFHLDRDRNRFILSHGQLRKILARYLHCDPRDVGFTAGKYGKPALVNSSLEFNLSHSGDYALIAVTQDHRVGIDVEQFRENIEFEPLARRFFSGREVNELMRLPLDQISTGFYSCWSRKEAYIKAHGLGLVLPLDSFDVSLTPGEPAVLRATRPDPTEAENWTLISIDVSSGYAGALAVEGKDIEFRYWDWNATR